MTIYAVSVWNAIDWCAEYIEYFTTYEKAEAWIQAQLENDGFDNYEDCSIEEITVN